MTNQLCTSFALMRMTNQWFGAQENILLSKYELCCLVLYCLDHPGVAVTSGRHANTCTSSSSLCQQVAQNLFQDLCWPAPVTTYRKRSQGAACRPSSTHRSPHHDPQLPPALPIPEPVSACWEPDLWPRAALRYPASTLCAPTEKCATAGARCLCKPWPASAELPPCRALLNTRLATSTAFCGNAASLAGLPATMSYAYASSERASARTP